MKTRKDALLGMSYGTAWCRLRKAIMFELAARLKLLSCFRCGEAIETIEEFSIDHTESWERSKSPVGSFFDLANIAFSHHACNCAAAFQPLKKYKDPKEQIRAKSKRLYADPVRRNHKNGMRRTRRARARATSLVALPMGLEPTSSP